MDCLYYLLCTLQNTGECTELLSVSLLLNDENKLNRCMPLLNLCLRRLRKFMQEGLVRTSPAWVGVENPTYFCSKLGQTTSPIINIILVACKWQLFGHHVQRPPSVNNLFVSSVVKQTKKRVVGLPLHSLGSVFLLLVGGQIIESLWGGTVVWGRWCQKWSQTFFAPWTIVDRQPFSDVRVLKITEMLCIYTFQWF